MQLEKWLKTQYAFLTLSSLLALSITLLIYGRVVAIPFYSDDLLQIPWARTASLNEIWGTLNPFSHFRPVQFSAWRLWQFVAGDLTPMPMRFFNLALHAGSGSLTGYLAFRLTHRDWWAGIGSTLLFVLFPFSYDAILWISSAAYPLAVFLGLLSIHSWINYCRLERRGWLYAALACAVGSALSLESGILVGLLLVVIDVIVLRRFVWQRALLPLSTSIIPLLAITFLTPTPSSPFELNRLIQNGAMVAQATTFPFSSLLHFPSDWFSPALLLWIAGTVFVTSVSIIGYRSKNLFSPLTFALIWIALWGVIPAVTQTYLWDRDPPRAFYPCAVGIALAWGVLLASTDTTRPTLKNAYRFLLGLALIVPIQFNIQTAGYYQQAGQLLQQVLESDPSVSSLYLNLPRRIGPKAADETWLLGSEGIIAMPPPTDNVALLLDVHGKRGEMAQNRINGAILADTSYRVSLAGQPFSVEDLEQSQVKQPLNIYRAEYAEGSSKLVQLGQLGANSTAGESFDYLLEDRLALSIDSCSTIDSREVELTLSWSILDEPINDGRSIFVHLWQDGEIVDQADGQFLAGLLPINTFKHESGHMLEQRRLIKRNASDYSVGIGLYNPADGKRSTAKNADGKLIDDNYIWLNCHQ